MNYELIASCAALIFAAYAICVLVVMALTFGVAGLFGNLLTEKGQPRLGINLLNVAIWLIASLIAGAVVQLPIGANTLTTTGYLAAILLIVQIRATFVMKRQLSAGTQIALCMICPMAVFAVWEFVP